MSKIPGIERPWTTRELLFPNGKDDLKARGLAREGGVLICDYCGFAIIVEGPRECCPKGITHDQRRGLPV